jgi:hypothetical protein
VHEFNVKTDPRLFHVCCGTCNTRHGAKSAVVVTALYIAENELEWPEVTLPNKSAGLWADKGSRPPWRTGRGYNKGFILMPTAVGGWAFKPGEPISLSVVGLFLVSAVCVHSPIALALT